MAMEDSKAGVKINNKLIKPFDVTTVIKLGDIYNVVNNILQVITNMGVS